MNRRIQLWLGVSACALLGAVTVPAPAVAESPGGTPTGSSQDNDPDPDGGFQHECGEPGGCAEAGESFESSTPDERNAEDRLIPIDPAQPRSGHGGLSGGDSVHGGVNDGGLGGTGGGLGE